MVTRPLRCGRSRRTGVDRLRPAGGGMEFQVFEAAAPDGTKVVLRTPAGGRFQSNPNDRHVDTRSLLRWESDVTRHLGRLGFPVAAPRELVLGEPDVLVSDFILDDGRGADQVALGRCCCGCTSRPPPTVAPVAAAMVSRGPNCAAPHRRAVHRAGRVRRGSARRATVGADDPVLAPRPGAARWCTWTCGRRTCVCRWRRPRLLDWSNA